ncbi:hypothetical protein BH10ACI2_BH10ACI2_05320 [soil metagenome]
MTEKSPTSKQAFSADWFLRGALTKIGDTFDRFTGRRWTPSSSLATSELIESMKKLLDAEAKEIPGKGKIVPHNIKLKMQWDKFSTDSEAGLKKLEVELSAAAADHINDTLCYTLAPLHIEVKPDYFTEGVKLFVSFDKFDEEGRERELNVTLPGTNEAELGLPAAAQPQDVTETYIARFTLKGSRRDRRLEFQPSGRVSVGRSGVNGLVLEDVSVSKIHASLICNAQAQLQVADTGSTNGTFVNGNRISYGKAVVVKSGDHVAFGDVDVVFDYVPRPEADVPTPEPMVPLSTDTVRVGGMTFTSRTSPDSKLATQPAGTSFEMTEKMDSPILIQSESARETYVEQDKSE